MTRFRFVQATLSLATVTSSTLLRPTESLTWPPTLLPLAPKPPSRSRSVVIRPMSRATEDLSWTQLTSTMSAIVNVMARNSIQVIPSQCRCPTLRPRPLSLCSEICLEFRLKRCLSLLFVLVRPIVALPIHVAPRQGASPHVVDRSPSVEPDASVTRLFYCCSPWSSAPHPPENV